MSSEHWFDRLSTRLTRRQAVKGALFGAAVLAAPISGARTARADDPGSSQKCFKGCTWMASQLYDSTYAACRSQNPEAWSVGPYGGGGPVAKAIRQGCADKALLVYKAAWYDCLQPGCSGFDPKQKGGPCDGCQSNCCTCQASDNGFICCIFTCDDTMHSCCPGG
jgi:hypothetical protein